MGNKFLVLALALALVFGVSSVVSAVDLKDRLKGYILLQVEANGEAWYVNPADAHRYYMKDGEAAYQMMRQFGLGATNETLRKIPIGIDDRFYAGMMDSDGDGLPDKLEEAIGTDPFNSDTDGDGFDDKTEIINGYDPLGAGRMMFDMSITNGRKGVILLQVQSRGEAWYINPHNGMRYYLPNGTTAYQIMKYLSLGITNDNLLKIPAKELAVSPDIKAAIIECGPTDNDCFINAARTCSLVRQNAVSSITLGALNITGNEYRELRGMEDGLCLYYKKFIHHSVSVNQAYLEELGMTQQEIAEIRNSVIESVDETNLVFANTDGVCRFQTTDLVNMLLRWEQGEFSTSDFSDKDCTGSYYDKQKFEPITIEF